MSYIGLGTLSTPPLPTPPLPTPPLPTPPLPTPDSDPRVVTRHTVAVPACPFSARSTELAVLPWLRGAQPAPVLRCSGAPYITACRLWWEANPLPCAACVRHERSLASPNRMRRQSGALSNQRSAGMAVLLGFCALPGMQA